MKHSGRMQSLLFIVVFSVAFGAAAQEGGFFARPKEGLKAPAKSFAHQGVQGCRGAITLVQDLGDETWKTTAANFNVPAGGGEGGRFDKNPLLTAKVSLKSGCLN